jgi:hypothetical protein
MIEFVRWLSQQISNADTMKMKAHLKSNRLQTRANSGSFFSNTTRRDFHAASKALVCFGWLRLYQTILLNESRTRHALPH